MEVFYSGSLWSCQQAEGTPGVPCPVGWSFSLFGQTCHLPVLYRFPQGLVFDLLCVLDAGACRAFYEAYRDRETEDPVDLACLEEENPARLLEMPEVLLDGVTAKSQGSSGAAILPWDDAKSPLHSALLEAYGSFAPEGCFSVTRVCVATAAVFPRTMTLCFPETQRFLPLRKRLCFPAVPGVSIEEGFVHPATGTEHRLYAWAGDPVELGSRFGGPKAPPLKTRLLKYEVAPALPPAHALWLVDRSAPSGEAGSTAAFGALSVCGEDCTGPHGEKVSYFSPQPTKMVPEAFSLELGGIYVPGNPALTLEFPLPEAFSPLV